MVFDIDVRTDIGVGNDLTSTCCVADCHDPVLCYGEVVAVVTDNGDSLDEPDCIKTNLLVNRSASMSGILHATI